MKIEKTLDFLSSAPEPLAHVVLDACRMLVEFHEDMREADLPLDHRAVAVDADEMAAWLALWRTKVWDGDVVSSGTSHRTFLYSLRAKLVVALAMVSHLEDVQEDPDLTSLIGRVHLDLDRVVSTLKKAV